eukprot:g3179.t1
MVHACVFCICISLLISIPYSLTLSVNITYSFHLPKTLGEATPASAKCCPFAQLPQNETLGMVPPTVFGIGAQKGGTTTLYSYFTRNSFLHGTTKELHYMDSADVLKNQTLRPYLSRWRYNILLKSNNTSNQTNTGPLFEISPSYMLIPFAACRAKYIAPNGKFIVLLREPANRAYSGFTYTSNLLKKRNWEARFLSQSFLEAMTEGITELDIDTNCDFHSGTGVKSYNDCFGCTLRALSLRHHCESRPFITLTDAKGEGFKCNKIGKEVILRGMYGAQLAWWFTLLPPSQFQIFNSVDFFANPELVMRRVIEFLGLSQMDTEQMLEKRSRSNTGKYHEVDQTEIDQAKQLLRQYYKRPNLELYRLMNETGHAEFTPFEIELEDLEHLDCMKPSPSEKVYCETSAADFVNNTSINSTTSKLSTDKIAVFDDFTIHDVEKSPVNEVEMIKKTAESSEPATEDAVSPDEDIQAHEFAIEQTDYIDKDLKEGEGEGEEQREELTNVTTVTNRKQDEKIKLPYKTVEASSVEFVTGKQTPIKEVIKLQSRITNNEQKKDKAKNVTEENWKRNLLPMPTLEYSQFSWASDYYIHMLFAAVLVLLLVYGLCMRNQVPKQHEK